MRNRLAGHRDLPGAAPPRVAQTGARRGEPHRLASARRVRSGIVTERTPVVVLEGLAFPEGPRWHDGRLFFSDEHDRRVVVMDESGTAETVIEVPQQPSGLGWLPDGRMLIVSMLDRRLLRLEGDRLVEH